MHWQYYLDDSKHPDYVLRTPLTGSRTKSGHKKSCRFDFHSQKHEQASDTFHTETPLSAPAQPKLGMRKVSLSKSAL